MHVEFRKVELYFIENMVWFINLALYIIFIFVVPRSFLSFHNIHFLLYVGSMIGFLMLGEALVLIGGKIDLSLDANAGLSAVIVGYLLAISFPGLPGYVGIILIILVGGLLGAINGFLVSYVGLNPFLVTLSTLLIFRWGHLAIRTYSITALPPSYLAPGSADIIGIKLSIFLVIGAIIILHFILTRTKFGSNIHSVGANYDVSRILGINAKAVTFWVYVIAGALAGVAGLLYTGYMGAVTANLAENEVFMAFAGAVIGGVSLAGGEGNMVGVFGGMILIQILDQGLAMLSIDPNIRGMAMGGLLLVSLFINLMRNRIRDKILTPK